MNEAQRLAIKAMLQRRTAENTRSESDARKWILQDGMHDRTGKLKKRFKVPRQQDVVVA